MEIQTEVTGMDVACANQCCSNIQDPYSVCFHGHCKLFRTETVLHVFLNQLSHLYNSTSSYHVKCTSQREKDNRLLCLDLIFCGFASNVSYLRLYSLRHFAEHSTFQSQGRNDNPFFKAVKAMQKYVFSINIFQNVNKMFFQHSPKVYFCES